MSKKERINEAFAYLRSKGIIHTQKDLADLVGTTSPNVSSALKGVDAVLTENFLKRFNNATGLIFNTDWLLYGEGEMLRRPSVQQTTGDHSPIVSGDNNTVNTDAATLAMREVAEQRQIVSKQAKQIDRLIAVIEHLTGAAYNPEK